MIIWQVATEGWLRLATEQARLSPACRWRLNRSDQRGNAGFFPEPKTVSQRLGPESWVNLVLTAKTEGIWILFCVFYYSLVSDWPPSWGFGSWRLATAIFCFSRCPTCSSCPGEDTAVITCCIWTLLCQHRIICGQLLGNLLQLYINAMSAMSLCHVMLCFSLCRACWICWFCQRLMTNGRQNWSLQCRVWKTFAEVLRVQDYRVCPSLQIIHIVITKGAKGRIMLHLGLRSFRWCNDAGAISQCPSCGCLRCYLRAARSCHHKRPSHFSHACGAPGHPLAICCRQLWTFFLTFQWLPFWNRKPQFWNSAWRCILWSWNRNW